jgi:hypothetical protein
MTRPLTKAMTIHLTALALALGGIASVQAQEPAQPTEIDSNITTCLTAWGKHPFPKNPSYKTLQVSVKVFGIGQPTIDADKTSAPALVLVQPGVNVMGGSSIDLLNPNGWYCMKTSVNVMGGMTIRAACSAKLAFTTDGTTVAGTNEDSKGVTVLGSTRVERVDCPAKAS